MSLWLLLVLGFLTTLALGIGVINRIFPPSPPPPEKRGSEGTARAREDDLPPVDGCRGAVIDHVTDQRHEPRPPIL